jgi:predicted transglutaminase-like cysteine proteinase
MRKGLALLLLSLSSCSPSLHSYNIDRPSPFSVTEYSKFNSVFEQVSKLEYKREAAGEDYWQTEAETDKLGTGDCEDYAISLMTKLTRQGILCDMRVGKFHESDQENHAWNRVNLEGKEYIVDAVMKGIFPINRIPSSYYREERDLNFVKHFNRKMIDAVSSK